MCEKHEPASRRTIEELARKGCFIRTTVYGPLEECVTAGQKIEVLCSYGVIHHFTVLYKEQRWSDTSRRNVTDVIAVEPEGDPVVLLSSMSDHYDAAWRFTEGTHSVLPRERGPSWLVAILQEASARVDAWPPGKRAASRQAYENLGPSPEWWSIFDQ